MRKTKLRWSGQLPGRRRRQSSVHQRRSGIAERGRSHQRERRRSEATDTDGNQRRRWHDRLRSCRLGGAPICSARPSRRRRPSESCGFRCFFQPDQVDVERRNRRAGLQNRTLDRWRHVSQIATTASGLTTFTDTGLTAGKSYSYRVRSTNAAADSLYSNIATASTPALSLPAPWVDGDIGPWREGKCLGQRWGLHRPGLGRGHLECCRFVQLRLPATHG